MRRLHHALQRTFFNSVIVPNSNLLKPRITQEDQLVSILLALPIGARYETSNSHGAACMIKNSAFLSNKYESRIALAKEADICGARIGSFLDRERLMLFCSVPTRNAVQAVQFLVAIAGSHSYLPHEFEDIKSLLKTNWETYQTNAERVILEALHHVAFRTGLGNSIYADPHIWEHSQKEPVEAFKCTALEFLARKPNSIAALVQGMDADEWSRLLGDARVKERIDSFFPSQSTSKSEQLFAREASRYYGGELRISSIHSDQNYFAIAFPVGNPATLDDVAEFLVLHELLSSCSSIPFAARENGLFSFANVDSFLDYYTDASLLSIIIALPKGIKVNQSIQEVIDKLYSLADGKYSSSQMSIAKEKAAMKLLSVQESAFERLNFASKMLQLFGAVQPVELVVERIKNVAQSKLVERIKTMLNSRPSVVSLGQLNDIPFADELNFAPIASSKSK